MDEPRQARTQSNPTLTVQGVGIARVRPDGVRIGLTVRHRAEASDEALAEAARQAEALEELFREFGLDEGRWVTAWLGLQEWTEWEESSRRETRRGYIATSRVEVSLPDTGSVGKLLTGAAARAEATVDGPRWEVAPDNPAQGEARRLAMADARRRAETYAEAAGLELGPIVEMAEVGAERTGGAMRMATHAVALAGGAAAEMPTHSEGLEIVAGVDVTYLLGSR
jgi:uncharacterized protein YggE